MASGAAGEPSVRREKTKDSETLRDRSLVIGDAATSVTFWQFIRNRPERCATGFGCASLRTGMPRGPRLDARDPRWPTQRAVGSPPFLRRYIPPQGRRRSVTVPPLIQAVGA